MREWETSFWKTFFERKIDELDSGCVDRIDLTEENLCPENVIDVLQDMGYEYDDIDTKGWEQDTWITFTHTDTNHQLTLFYCGRTFKMELFLTD